MKKENKKAMKPVTTKVATYDRGGKKVLLHVTSENDMTSGDEVIGNSKQDIKQEYTINGFKGLWRMVQSQKNDLQQKIKTTKNKLLPLEVVDEDDELRLLKDNLEKLQGLQEKDKLEGELEQLEDNLKTVIDDIRELEPINKKIGGK